MVLIFAIFETSLNHCYMYPIFTVDSFVFRTFPSYLFVMSSYFYVYINKRFYFLFSHVKHYKLIFILSSKIQNVQFWQVHSIMKKKKKLQIVQIAGLNNEVICTPVMLLCPYEWRIFVVSFLVNPYRD